MRIRQTGRFRPDTTLPEYGLYTRSRGGKWRLKASGTCTAMKRLRREMRLARLEEHAR